MNHIKARYLSEIYRMLERREVVAAGVLAEMFRVKPSSSWTWWKGCGERA
ncbi:MAG: hypothetical protein QW243_05685 [Candidatus Caldarchaeum sp.]